MEVTELLKINEEEGMFTAKIRLTVRWYATHRTLRTLLSRDTDARTHARTHAPSWPAGALCLLVCALCAGVLILILKPRAVQCT